MFNNSLLTISSMDEISSLVNGFECEKSNLSFDSSTMNLFAEHDHQELLGELHVTNE